MPPRATRINVGLGSKGSGYQENPATPLLLIGRGSMGVPCWIRIFVLKLVQVVNIGYFVRSMGSSSRHTINVLSMRYDGGAL
jgi:hypothetical protein